MLKIGDVASEAGVNVQTLRYYERLELLRKADRTEGGFRLYSPDAIRRVRFIKKAQALGFSLDEIRDLLALDDAPTTTCSQMRDVLGKKIATVKEMIRNLNRLQKALTTLADRCPGDQQKREACPILESLVEDR